jgi:hypothetical protein
VLYDQIEAHYGIPIHNQIGFVLIGCFNGNNLIRRVKYVALFDATYLAPSRSLLQVASVSFPQPDLRSLTEGPSLLNLRRRMKVGGHLSDVDDIERAPTQQDSARHCAKAPSPAGEKRKHFAPVLLRPETCVSDPAIAIPLKRTAEGRDIIGMV